MAWGGFGFNDGGGQVVDSVEGCGEGPFRRCIDDWDDWDEELLLIIEEVARGGGGFNDDGKEGEQPDDLCDEVGGAGRG